MIDGIAHRGSPNQSTGSMPTSDRPQFAAPYRVWNRYRQITATATTVVTTGANNAVRNTGLKRASFECSSNAAASDTKIDSGTPATTKYSVLPSAFQNSGLPSSLM